MIFGLHVEGVHSLHEEILPVMPIPTGWDDLTEHLVAVPELIRASFREFDENARIPVVAFEKRHRHVHADRDADQAHHDRDKPLHPLSACLRRLTHDCSARPDGVSR